MAVETIPQLYITAIVVIISRHGLTVLCFDLSSNAMIRLFIWIGYCAYTVIVITVIAIL